jgi:hypothetical protein
MAAQTQQSYEQATHHLLMIPLQDTHQKDMFSSYLIDWKATRQKSVTKSSTEAELVALSHAASESMW